MGGLGRSDFAKLGTEKYETPPFLGDTGVCGEEYFDGDMIIETNKLAQNAVKNLSVTQREQSRDVFKQKRLRLEFFKKPHVVFE